MVDIKSVDIKKDAESQVVIGHAGFIKSVEDIYEALVGSAPGIRFGLAFIEASGPCLIRSEGNDSHLKELAERNATAIGAGHTFIAIFNNAYPINVNNALKAVPEVVRIYCSTANPVQVLVAGTSQGAGIVGVVDGSSAKGTESDDDRSKRKKLLRDIGYKM
ncbi:adenosine-specific kinase [Candidatus Marsarchaeota archaeon]|nr:adenosine-specific kinase [Candidatus Marsarchaeota archaeon]